MTLEEIRERFDEAMARGDMNAALALIHQAEDAGFDSTAMRDIWGRRDADYLTD